MALLQALFGLRVMPSGAKSFILEYRANGGGRGVAKSWLTLGRYGVITVDQARQAALTALARIRLGSDPQAEKNRQRSALSINDLAERFLEDRASALKPKTEKNYSAALAKLRKAHGTIKATALTREQVAALHKSMRTAPYAANWFLAAVSGLFSWASAQGLIPKEHANPARQIPRYREFARERFLTQDELARLGAALRTAPVDRYAVAAILVLLLTGARLNEILHARRDWLDAERGLLNLPDSKVGRRSLFLSAQALAVLQSLPRMHGKTRNATACCPSHVRAPIAVSAMSSTQTGAFATTLLGMEVHPRTMKASPLGRRIWRARGAHGKSSVHTQASWLSLTRIAMCFRFESRACTQPTEHWRRPRTMLFCESMVTGLGRMVTLSLAGSLAMKLERGRRLPQYNSRKVKYAEGLKCKTWSRQRRLLTCSA